MPSTYQRSIELTRESIALAAVPAVASLLSVSKVAQVLSAGPGGGVTFPLPTGLPTLWTYVSLPSGPGGVTFGGPLSFAAFVPLFLLGLLVTSALEAGFLGSLDRRIDDRPVDFLESVRAYVLRIIGVNLIRAIVVFLVLPLMFFPPLALVVILALMYLVYGLPFEIVVRDVDLLTGLNDTVSKALSGGPYAGFGAMHIVGGAAGSILLTLVVRNGGIPGVLLGIAIVAVPAVFVASYGLFVFRELAGVSRS